jgi:hypothetical protein
MAMWIRNGMVTMNRMKMKRRKMDWRRMRRRRMRMKSRIKMGMMAKNLRRLVRGRW